MRIKFVSEHLSIKRFQEIETGPLVVMTGLNGAGKSHLLSAIEAGSVIVEPFISPKVVRFNFENFRLENEDAFSSHQIRSDKEAAWNLFQGSYRQNFVNMSGYFGDTVFDENFGAVWERHDIPNISLYTGQIENLFRHPHNIEDPTHQAILNLARRISKPLDRITKEDFLESINIEKRRLDFLPGALGKIIWEYYEKYIENEFNEFENMKFGSNRPVMSDEDFTKAYGEKPWLLLNRILGSFSSLDYRINSPEGLSHSGTYQLKLESTRDQTLRIDFEHLSSGERILMALVASVYTSTQKDKFPDIFLLDELDASLHPSMVKNLLAVIGETFTARGSFVLLVSHSPSTIAFAQESSIFVMHKSGLNRIEKTSKKNALSILTEGFATIDDGLLLIDSLPRDGIIIFSEGWNTAFIKEAIKQSSLEDVTVVDGLESMSGDSQLRTLFDFFCRIPHKSTVIFVWDCDVTYRLTPCNLTYPFIFERNINNQIARKGIENLFPEELFVGLQNVINKSDGTVIREFDKDKKRDFENRVLERSNPKDFELFRPLIKRILELKEHGESSPAG